MNRQMFLVRKSVENAELALKPVTSDGLPSQMQIHQVKHIQCQLHSNLEWLCSMASLSDNSLCAISWYHFSSRVAGVKYWVTSRLWLIPALASALSSWTLSIGKCWKTCLSQIFLTACSIQHTYAVIQDIYMDLALCHLLSLSSKVPADTSCRAERLSAQTPCSFAITC